MNQISLRAVASVALWTCLSISTSHTAHAGDQPLSKAGHSPEQDLPAFLVSPHQNVREVLQYWTDERMTVAEEIYGNSFIQDECLTPGVTPEDDVYCYAPSPAPYGNQAFSRITGMLFATYDGVPTHCSASVITSANKSLLVTAAHCVKLLGNQGGWQKHLMFVPAYNSREGSCRAPFGKWPLDYVYAPIGNVEHPDIDVAVARVFPFHGAANDGSCPSLEEGRLLEDVVGAFRPRVSKADELLGLVRTLGYPGDLKYQGMQWYCVDNATSGESEGYSSAIMTTHCPGFKGNSGGPLLCDYNVITMKCMDALYRDPEVVGVFSGIGGKHARLLQATFGVMYDAANQP